MFLVVSVLFTLLNASEDHNLTDAQLHAVMGIITSFILMPSSKELALQKIQMYAQTNGSTLVPNIQDYEDAEVTGVNTGNLMELNEAVEYLGALDVDTTEKIQALVDALVIVHNNTTYGTVTSPYTGKVWLDRNLGAAQVCTSFNDTACYGDYYQWGRNLDGHQDSTSATTSTQATDVNGTGSSFITSNSYPYDWTTTDRTGATRTANWSTTDGSSACPVGFRVPTLAELQAETLDNGVTNSATAFSNFLKLPSAGSRVYTSGALRNQGSWGYVWAGSVNGSYSRNVNFGSSYANTNDGNRAYGFAVRCLRD